MSGTSAGAVRSGRGFSTSGRGAELSNGKLSALQARILSTLADTQPRFTLSGGGALALSGLIDRETRDLDLFWRGVDKLGSIAKTIATTLEASGLAVSTLQTAPAFARFSVSDGKGATLLDLVAEQVPPVHPPQAHRLGEKEILLDSAHEILINKLCALLSRSELRDLQDLRTLVERGGELDRALADAPRKDTGFSALTLAWVLKNFPVRSLSASLGLDAQEAARLDEFRVGLIGRLIAPG